MHIHVYTSTSTFVHAQVHIHTNIETYCFIDARRALQPQRVFVNFRPASRNELAAKRTAVAFERKRGAQRGEYDRVEWPFQALT